MVNHRVDASHGEFPGEDRGIRGNSPDPTGTESHSERARQLHWKKIYADHPMLTMGVPLVNDQASHQQAGQRSQEILGFGPRTRATSLGTYAKVVGRTSTFSSSTSHSLFVSKPGLPLSGNRKYRGRT